MTLIESNLISGVLLAGGRSRRLGRDKAMEMIGGQPLIHRVLARLDRFCDELVVVVADPERSRVLAMPPKVRTVVDQYPDTGSLGGILSGVRGATHPWSVVVACDMPFLNVELFWYMLTLRSDVSAVVPLVGGRLEPLHALYHQACLSVMEEQVANGELKISRFLQRVPACHPSEEVLTSYDPDLLSFFNINTQEDLDRANELELTGR